MADDGAASITVAVRVRPFTIREASQLSKTEDGPVFLGDGSLVAATPKLSQKGIRTIVKVVDDKCLYVEPPFSSLCTHFSQGFRSTRKQSSPKILSLSPPTRQESEGPDFYV